MKPSQLLKHILLVTIIVFCQQAVAGKLPNKKTFTNSIAMKFARIEPGEFQMGFEGKPLHKSLLEKIGNLPDGDYDEYPRHKVIITKPFYMAAFEVTNAQYEMFDPAHKKFRGRRKGCSEADNEAVVFISWHDAQAFCDWLSKKENLPYRLPTEAEWEFACRAGSKTVFYTGDNWPEDFNDELSAPLTVGKAKPNPWGLYDMHGNAEEWCHDWYGPYIKNDQTDPIGRIDGNFKVIRGGSHSTQRYFLRSANRIGTLPEDKQWLTGFRLVIGQLPKTTPLPPAKPAQYQKNVIQTIPTDLTKQNNPDKPYFKGPLKVVNITKGSKGPLWSEHNHFMAVTESQNGDLLAAWFTCQEEMGRELGIAASRLRYRSDKWEPASPFWDAPDRNDHTTLLWHDGKNTIWHFNGISVLYRELAVILRKSTDNGVTWSKAKLIQPEHDRSSGKVIESVFRAQNQNIVLPLDGRGGSMLLISKDNGNTWYDPEGAIRGTHAGVAQLNDGSLIAFGRHGAIDGKMPISISSDFGKSWTYKPSHFQPIHSGRRVALIKLKQGPLLLVSFAIDMMIKDTSGNQRPVSGMFAATSLDDGKTWPYRRLVTDDCRPKEIETMDGDPIIMDSTNAEPVGYLGITQTKDGLVHLLTSRNHYSFNLAWLTTLPPKAPPPLPAPEPQILQAKHQLPNIYKPIGLPSKHDWEWKFNCRGAKENDIIELTADGLLKTQTNASQQFWFRTQKIGGFADLNPRKGFTAEIKAQIINASTDNRGLDFELYDGAGSRYAFTITETAIYWYDGTVLGSAFLPFSEYKPIAENLDNTDSMHTYRFTVRPDRVVQIYRDGKLIALKKYIYRTPRYPYICFGTGPNTNALIEHIAYDLNKPAKP